MKAITPPRTISVANLDTATMQEVFDFIAYKLLEQGKQSLAEDDSNVCLYHGPNGLRCAAGFLLSDEVSTEGLEGCGWGDLVADSMVPSAHRNIISSMQNVHDLNAPSEWPRLLRDRAVSHFFLSTSFLDAYEAAPAC